MKLRQGVAAGRDRNAGNPGLPLAWLRQAVIIKVWTGGAWRSRLCCP